MEDEDEPPDCKYKPICSWYSSDCYEPSCWRAISLDAIISKSKLELIVENKIEDKGNE